MDFDMEGSARCPGLPKGANGAENQAASAGSSTSAPAQKAWHIIISRCRLPSGQSKVKKLLIFVDKTPWILDIQFDDPQIGIEFPALFERFLCSGITLFAVFEDRLPRDLAVSHIHAGKRRYRAGRIAQEKQNGARIRLALGNDGRESARGLYPAAKRADPKIRLDSHRADQALATAACPG
ncbi:MAG: hypothetical protein U9R73_09545 [Pseudomonadota bacterium]|nr:hypothetical protein [Pseudomonadota bacterium]